MEQHINLSQSYSAPANLPGRSESQRRLIMPGEPTAVPRIPDSEQTRATAAAKNGGDYADGRMTSSDVGSLRGGVEHRRAVPHTHAAGDTGLTSPAANAVTPTPPATLLERERLSVREREREHMPSASQVLAALKERKLNVGGEGVWDQRERESERARERKSSAGGEGAWDSCERENRTTSTEHRTTSTCGTSGIDTPSLLRMQQFSNTATPRSATTTTASVRGACRWSPIAITASLSAFCLFKRIVFPGP
jgi:hypothetical protein